MSAAATVAIDVADTGLSIALFICAMRLAAILTERQLVGHMFEWTASNTVLSVHVMLNLGFWYRVVDFRCQRPRTDVSFDQCMALQGTILCHLATALAMAVVI